MSGREWQKVDRTTLSLFLEIWLSLVEISSWTLVKDEQEGSQLSSSVLCLCWNFGLGLYTWAMLIPLFTWACSPSIICLDLQNGHQRHNCHGLSSLMESYC